MTETELKPLLQMLGGSPWDLRKSLEDYVKVVQITKGMPEKTRTGSQNNSIHLWCEQKAEQCREAGVTWQMILAKTLALDMTKDAMKAIWKAVLKGAFNQDSTTEVKKNGGEIKYVTDHLNLFFAEKFNLPTIDFPHDPDKENQKIKGMEIAKKMDYSTEYQEPTI